MKAQCLICWLLLLFNCAGAQNANTLITLEMLNGTGHPGYYKTYDDFLNGRMVESQSVRIMDNLVFMIGGKSVTIAKKDIWGFRDNKNRLIRINPRDLKTYAVYGLGDIIYYDDNFRYTPGQIEWSGQASTWPDLIGDFELSVHYKKDGSAVHAYFSGGNDKWSRETISANLNSTMITHKEFDDDKTFYTLAAGDTSLLNFASRWPRNNDHIARIDLKLCGFARTFDDKSHPRYVTYSRNRGKEIYFR